MLARNWRRRAVTASPSASRHCTEREASAAPVAVAAIDKCDWSIAYKDHWNHVRRMGRIRASGRGIAHRLAIAVIRRYEQCTIYPLDRPNMSGLAKLRTSQVVTSGSDPIDRPCCELGCRHFRLEIVSGDLRRG